MIVTEKEIRLRQLKYRIKDEIAVLEATIGNLRETLTETRDVSETKKDMIAIIDYCDEQTPDTTAEWCEIEGGLRASQRVLDFLSGRP